jgi:aspartoacylase
LKPIQSVAIVGGTHGNELTGVYCVKHWQKQNKAADYPEFAIEYLLANPEAIKANKRYLEKDLNRCFKLADLASDLPAKNNYATPYEQGLAQKINQQLGPKGQARIDFIIDLHTSTTNMQTNVVIIKTDQFHLKLAAYLKQTLPDVVITTESELMDEHHFLMSISDAGFLVEVGPIAQGTLDANCMQQTNNALAAGLEFVRRYQNNSLPKLGDSVEIMSYHGKLHFPLDSQGEVMACVHPSLINQAYPLIRLGDPLFQTFDGETITYQGEPSHLAFINEAAYYDQNIAMCLCQAKRYKLHDERL